ncbi:hypothetical protein E8E11_004166 [Didymella keratinophila]|nr:hypothetical protein E8E11_004166 [Didymella keratinophila]
MDYIDNNGVPVYSCNSTSTDSYCCYDGCDCQANSGFEIFTFAQSPADVYTLTIIGESFTQTHISSASSTAATTSASVPASVSNSASTAVPTAGSSAPAGTASSTSTSAPAAEPENKSNTTALGVGLGVGIPVAALIGVGIFFLLRRRRNRYADSPASELAVDEYTPNHTSPSTKYAHTAEAEMATAAPTAPVTHELSGERTGPAELPAESAPSTAGGARAMELESPLSSPAEGTTRTT